MPNYHYFEFLHFAQNLNFSFFLPITFLLLTRPPKQIFCVEISLIQAFFLFYFDLIDFFF